MTFMPPAYQRREIAGRTLIKEATVRRAYQHPLRCKPATLERVRRAARALGIPEPLVPEPSPEEPSNGHRT